MGDCPPPVELKLAWRCARYSTLPEVGGLNDQPAGMLERMDAATTVYNAVSGWNRAFLGGSDLKKWIGRHAREWEVTQMWIKLKDEDGKGTANNN